MPMSVGISSLAHNDENDGHQEISDMERDRNGDATRRERIVIKAIAIAIGDSSDGDEVDDYGSSTDDDDDD